MCCRSPWLLDEVVKVFVNAQIEHPGPGDGAKGAALLLADSRGLLTALPVGFFSCLVVLFVCLLYRYVIFSPLLSPCIFLCAGEGVRRSLPQAGARGPQQEGACVYGKKKTPV